MNIECQVEEEEKKIMIIFGRNYEMEEIEAKNWHDYEFFIYEMTSKI